MVTGASGGVVAGIARRVVEAGAAVVVHYRSDADGAAAVVDAIGAAGSRAISASAELLDRAAEPTRFSSPMLDDCCRATRPPAGRPCSHLTPLEHSWIENTWPCCHIATSSIDRRIEESEPRRERSR